MNASVLPGAVVPPLALSHWPADNRDLSLPPLVLVHGWGGDSAVWSELIPLLQQRGLEVISLDLPGFGASPAAQWQLDSVLEQLGEALPQRCLLLGWSLGGMLATAYARRYPERVAGLITIATNASFAQRNGWEPAMAQHLLRQFQRSFVRDAAATLQQFTALQARGDRRERAVLRALRSRLPDAVPCQWEEALALLGELDNRAALEALTLPALHVFGASDNLVPVAAAEAIGRLNPRATVRVLPGVAHAPQLSAADELAAMVTAFACQLDDEKNVSSDSEYRIDKRQVARSFSRAAATYDQAAHLQRATGEELLQRLPHQLSDDWVMDLGCGTGVFTEQLAQRYPGATVVGIDLAEGMIAHARRHHPEAGSWLCGDAEAMPCADNRLGLVFSNFALQWCQDLPRLMAEQYRVLCPGGSLVFSTVGPDSLGELRQAWLAVDSYVHVNRFSPLETVRGAIEGAGFAIDDISVVRRVSYYPRLQDLTRELKGLGAHNVNQGRNTGLTGRRQIAALKAAYEKWRTPEGLPASWEIFTVVAVKPS